jgi:ribosomal protein S6--L-glutamate ligase
MIVDGPRAESGASLMERDFCRMRPYFVSFNPDIRMEENLPVFSSLDEPEVRCLLEGAAGVVLPSYVTPWRYRSITRWCRSWFPRLDARFDYCGKTSQIMLFRALGVRHPESALFGNAEELRSYVTGIEPFGGYPFVLKGDAGGGGSAVFPIRSPEDLLSFLKRLPPDRPMLLQRWVEHGGKDLRVVVYGQLAVSYFRVGDGRFYNNVCRGGRLDHDSWPEHQKKGVEAVRAFCDEVAIDVAGFDLMFPDSGDPVFVEINFHFGRKGLGGTKGHRRFMNRAVKDWREACLQAIQKPET